jgi:hypothetical protein
MPNWDPGLPFNQAGQVFEPARYHIRGVIYLADLAFVVEGSQAAVLCDRDLMDKTLCGAGLQRHPSKGQFNMPFQALQDHLGYEINIPLNVLHMSEQSFHTIHKLDVALHCEQVARN